MPSFYPFAVLDYAPEIAATSISWIEIGSMKIECATPCCSDYSLTPHPLKLTNINIRFSYLLIPQLSITCFAKPYCELKIPLHQANKPIHFAVHKTKTQKARFPAKEHFFTSNFKTTHGKNSGNAILSQSICLLCWRGFNEHFAFGHWPEIITR